MIYALTTESYLLTPSQSITLKVWAEDPEGNPLEIRWFAEYGRIKRSTQDQTVIIYQAPHTPGLYVVGVTVTDNMGKCAHRAILLEVVAYMLPREWGPPKRRVQRCLDTTETIKASYA